MKKIIYALCSLAIIFAASCSDDKLGNIEPTFEPVSSISIADLDKKEKAEDRDQKTVHVNKEGKIEINFLPAYGTDKGEFTFKFESSNPTVATITASEDGKHGVYTTTEAQGETKVTVTAVNNPSFKAEFILVVTRVDIESLTTVSDYTKGMFIKLSDKNKYAEIGALKFTPADASMKEVEYAIEDETIATVEEADLPDGKDAEGKEKTRKAWIVKAVKQGQTKLTITPTDALDKAYEIEVNIVDVTALDKSAWIINLLGENLPAGEINLENVIDADETTFMTLAKPGRKNIAADAKLAFVIERENNTEFNMIQLTHNGEDVSERALALSLHGRNDLTADDWVVIKENIKITEADKKDQSQSPVISIDETTYKYVRVSISDWDRTSNSSDFIKIGEIDFLNFR